MRAAWMKEQKAKANTEAQSCQDLSNFWRCLDKIWVVIQRTRKREMDKHTKLTL